MTKLKLYRAIVLHTLLYVCETCPVHARQLNSFHMRCFWKLLYIKWNDKVPDTKVFQKAKMESIHVFLKLFQLRWAEHVLRMPDKRLLKRMLFGELIDGKRSLGG